MNHKHTHTSPVRVCPPHNMGFCHTAHRAHTAPPFIIHEPIYKSNSLSLSHTQHRAHIDVVYIHCSQQITFGSILYNFIIKFVLSVQLETLSKAVVPHHSGLFYMYIACMRHSVVDGRKSCWTKGRQHS